MKMPHTHKLCAITVCVRTLAFAKQDDFFSWFKPAYWINAVSVLHQWRMMPVLCSWHAKTKTHLLNLLLCLPQQEAELGGTSPLKHSQVNENVLYKKYLTQMQLDSCNRHSICVVHSSFWHLLLPIECDCAFMLEWSWQHSCRPSRVWRCYFSH